jgi:uncharacterized protein YciI
MRFVVWGTYCDDVLDKRVPFRREHLDGLQRQKDSGLLITLGPTADTRFVFGIYEAESQEQVEQALHADVYWREGIWTALQVHPWVQAF